MTCPPNRHPEQLSGMAHVSIWRTAVYGLNQVHEGWSPSLGKYSHSSGAHDGTAYRHIGVINPKRMDDPSAVNMFLDSATSSGRMAGTIGESSTSYGTSTNLPHLIHAGRLNMLFCDGHAETADAEKLGTVPNRSWSGDGVLYFDRAYGPGMELIYF